MKFPDKIKEIMNTIQIDINKCNAKQLKDVLIILDCKYTNESTFSLYKDEIKNIFKNYLSPKDRISIFLIRENYKIICPMAQKNKIDIENLSNELDKISNKEFLISKEEDEKEDENQINFEESYTSSINNNEIKSIDSNDEDKKNNFKLKEINYNSIINSINFCIKYLKMKRVERNENFLIFFTDLLERVKENNKNDEYIYRIFQKKIINKFKKDNKINFLIVGNTGSRDLESIDYVKENIKEILTNAFGSKSELIPMKKIKTILSSSNIITDKVIFPNEIYK